MNRFPSRFVVGLDLGQATDPSAMAILKVTDSGLSDAGWDPIPKFDVVHLEQLPLGNAYPWIVGRVTKLFESPALHYILDDATLTTEHYDPPQLVIDATGVGRAVVDMFLDARPDAETHPLTITAGDSVREERWNNSGAKAFWVGKRHLVSAIQAALQSGRLKVNPTLDDAPVLKAELLNFQVAVTESGHETFNARVGKHDDLVLATGMAVWIGSRPAQFGSWGAPPACVGGPTYKGLHDYRHPGLDGGGY